MKREEIKELVRNSIREQVSNLAEGVDPEEKNAEEAKKDKDYKEEDQVVDPEGEESEGEEPQEEACDGKNKKKKK